MTKWNNTPGPWVFDEVWCPKHDTTKFAILQYQTSDGKKLSGFEGGHGCMISEVVEPGCNCGDEAICNEEDGWLMAKSPELAEALEVILGKWLEDADPRECQHIINRAKQILEKAKNGVDNHVE